MRQVPSLKVHTVSSHEKKRRMPTKPDRSRNSVLCEPEMEYPGPAQGSEEEGLPGGGSGCMREGLARRNEAKRCQAGNPAYTKARKNGA